MRVLVVEDDPDFASEVLRIVDEAPGQSFAVWEKSRDAAKARLQDDFFDLIVLDLKIPTLDGIRDELAIHGDNVFRFAREVAPGTPIIVLTGSPAEDFVPTMLKGANQIDVWKSGQEMGIIQFIKKPNFDEFPEAVAVIARAIDGLSVVEIHSPDLQLIPEYDRLIRIFARGCGGVRCVVSRLGGLSSALVVRVKITSNTGAPVHEAVVKLGDIPSVRAENAKYDSQISRLLPAATPRKLELLHYGAKARAGLFYQLAAGFVENGFTLAAKGGAPAIVLPTTVEGLLSRWSDGFPQSQRTVKEIRQRLVSDDDYKIIVDAFGLSWTEAFEQNVAQTIWSCVHGDLHGENVLATTDGVGVLIDYGDVGDGPRSIDALTAEFSVLFHPKSSFVGGPWPTEEQALVWYDLDRYLAGCPCPDYIRSNRAWLNRVATGNREIAAIGYAYFLRQLQYDTTDGKLAVALLEGSRRLYLGT